MNKASQKLELIDWLMHISDAKILKQIENIKLQFSAPASNQPIFGRFKGKIVAAPDFDAPLDDFKEYM